MRQVDEGASLAAGTGRPRTRILAQAASINGVVAEIAASASGQSSSPHQINSAVRQMDQMTRRNAAMVERSTKASYFLGQEASEMARRTPSTERRGPRRRMRRRRPA